MKHSSESTDNGNLHASAQWGLAVLTFINLFNYLDRYLVSALAQSLKNSPLALSDFQLGLLMTGFLVVYMLAAPAFGAWGDERSRPRLIAAGVACWSVATALSGAVYSFWALLAARAAVGVGEAAYGTIAPGMLADYFRRSQRGRVMAIFVCAIPVGSALGYVVGGLVDKHFGWRMAFFVAGAPGCCSRCWLLSCPIHRAERRSVDATAQAKPAYSAMGSNSSHHLAQILQSHRIGVRGLYLCDRRAGVLDAVVSGARARHAARGGHHQFRRHRCGDGIRRHVRRWLAG